MLINESEEIGLLWLNVTQLEHRSHPHVHALKIKVSPLFTRACIHLRYVSTSASCNKHTQTDVLQTDFLQGA